MPPYGEIDGMSCEPPRQRKSATFVVDAVELITGKLGPFVPISSVLSIFLHTHPTSPILMLQFLQAILSGLFALTSNGSPFTSQVALTPQQTSTFLSQPTTEWLNNIREKYDVAGFGIGIVATPNRTGRDWGTEVLSFGHRDHHNNPYDPEVSFNCR